MILSRSVLWNPFAFTLTKKVGKLNVPWYKRTFFIENYFLLLYISQYICVDSFDSYKHTLYQCFPTSDPCPTEGNLIVKWTIQFFNFESYVHYERGHNNLRKETLLYTLCSSTQAPRRASVHIQVEFIILK